MASHSVGEDRSEDVSDQAGRLLRAKVFLSALTLAYLLVELPFNARLLDVVGGLSSQSDVHHIEIFGRLISGFAAALLWWGVVTVPRGIRKGRDNGDIALRMCLIGAVLISSVYVGEKQLVDSLVNNSTGIQRRAAVKLNVLSNDVRANRAGLGGIKLDTHLLTSPQGKTFIAFFPFMASHVSKLESKIQKTMRRLVRNKIRREIGDPQRVFNTRYIASDKKIKKAFHNYSRMVNTLATAYKQQRPIAERKWRHYLRRLHERFGRRRIPRRDYPKIRSHLRSEGLKVGENYRPKDKAAFFEAVYRNVKHRAYQRFVSASKKAFGAVLPTDLDSTARFAANPSIQAMWRRALGAEGDHGLHLDYNDHFKAFRQHVYKPLLAYRVAQRMHKIEAKSRSFDDGGANAKIGRDAVRAEIVPPIALVFSVIGGLSHVLKLLLMLTAVAAGFLFRSAPSPRHFRTRTVQIGTAMVYLVLVASVFWRPNTITRSPLFGYFEGQLLLATTSGPTAKASSTHPSPRQTKLAGGWAVVRHDAQVSWAHTESVFTRWIIQVQPVVYPVNEWLREHALAGFGYGVDPSSTS